MQLRINERTGQLTLLLIHMGLCVIAVPIMSFVRFSPVIFGASIVGMLTYGGLWLACRQGQKWSHFAVVIFTITIVAIALAFDQGTRDRFSPVFFVPLVFSLIFLGPLGSVATGITMLLLVSFLVSPPNPYTEPIRIATILGITAGIALARAVSDTMRWNAENATKAAQEAQEHAEAEAALAKSQAAELAARAEEQQRLLDLVADLETPAVTLRDGVLLTPIIGTLDSRRARNLTDRLLARIHEQRVKLVIIDLVGVSMVDTIVAQSLGLLISSMRLLGCRVAVTGISAQMAMTLTQLKVVFHDVTMARSPQEALEQYSLTNITTFNQN